MSKLFKKKPPKPTQKISTALAASLLPSSAFVCMPDTRCSAFPSGDLLNLDHSASKSIITARSREERLLLATMPSTLPGATIRTAASLPALNANMNGSNSNIDEQNMTDLEAYRRNPPSGPLLSSAPAELAPRRNTMDRDRPGQVEMHTPSIPPRTSVNPVGRAPPTPDPDSDTDHDDIGPQPIPNPRHISNPRPNVLSNQAPSQVQVEADIRPSNEEDSIEQRRVTVVQKGISRSVRKTPEAVERVNDESAETGEMAPLDRVDTGAPAPQLPLQPSPSVTPLPANSNEKDLELQESLETMRAENKALEETVRRLNSQLSVTQAAHAARSGELAKIDKKKIAAAIPPNGPIPSWLINAKYLSPLFLAYDQEIQERDQLIASYKNKLAEFEARVQNVVDENLLLRKQMHLSSIAGTGFPPISRIEPSATVLPGGLPDNWREVIIQAHQVVSENSDLMLAIERQRHFIADLEKLHKDQLLREQGETQRMAEERDEIAKKCTALMDRLTAYEQLQARGFDIPELQNAQHEMEIARKKVQEQHAQMRVMAENTVNVNAKNNQLAGELATLRKKYEKSEQRGKLLEELLKRYKQKEESTVKSLSNLLNSMEGTATQRDGFAQMALLLRNSLLEIIQQQTQQAQQMQLLQMAAIAAARSAAQSGTHTPNSNAVLLANPALNGLPTAPGLNGEKASIHGQFASPLGPGVQISPGSNGGSQVGSHSASLVNGTSNGLANGGLGKGVPARSNGFDSGMGNGALDFEENEAGRLPMPTFGLPSPPASAH